MVEFDIITFKVLFWDCDPAFVVDLCGSQVPGADYDALKNFTAFDQFW